MCTRSSWAPSHPLAACNHAGPDRLKNPVLDQRMVDGHRVDAGGLHRHVRDLLFGQPRGGLDKHATECFEHAFDGVPMVGAVARQPDRYRDDVFADVDRRAPLVENLHLPRPLPMLTRGAHAASGAPHIKLEAGTRAHGGNRVTPRGWRLQRQSLRRSRKTKPNRRRKATGAQRFSPHRERARQGPPESLPEMECSRGREDPRLTLVSLT